jgi:serine/threonine protein kinase
MAIHSGSRLGPYEILSAIGAGGMGEVYRARDTRLDRTVALKVLPPHLAGRSELRERFEREARTIAGLNHPHICVLHDIGQQEGINFLVMEYLEGETLAQRLLRGALPLEQVLQYAVEIADALDKAHRNGVTHRDLKPGNIMITRMGIKLLDFGLAKWKHVSASANSPLSELSTADATADVPLTAHGTILGTLQYMAPEQLEGNDVDARADIFAFGAVVYEMATGKKAFQGKSSASVISAIMSSDPPPISKLQPMTPPALDRTVKRCLAKNADDRWQSAADLADQLKWISGTNSLTVVAAPPPAPIQKTWRWSIGWMAAILIASAAVGIGVLYLKPTSPSARQVSRFTITLPVGDQLAELQNLVIAVSPDGSRLVYVASHDGVPQLYLRSMDSLQASPLPGTENATAPFFSPDGQWIGFFADGNLKKISAAGGATVTLTASRGGFLSAAWGPDGTILVNGLPLGLGITQIPDSGGSPKEVTTVNSKKGEIAHRLPMFLPGGKALLFLATTGTPNSSNMQIEAAQIGSGVRRTLGAGGSPAYAPSGHLIFAQAGVLMAAPFDAGRMEITGSAVPVLEGVMQSATSGLAQYNFSDSGTLAYIPGSLQGAHRLIFVDRKGTETPLEAPARLYGYPRLSPDGRRVAAGFDGQIWIYDLARQTLSRLTFQGDSLNLNPAWTPDGKHIVFQSSNGGPFNLYLQPADGSGAAERLTNSNDTRQAASTFSRDGQFLAFTQTNSVTASDIWVMRMSDHSAQAFLQTPANEGAPQFSPDGHWLAYSSNESGKMEVYVQPYPGPGGKWQISVSGGAEPVWNPNGRELFFRSGNKMMAVDVSTQGTFTPGKPRMLFEGPYLQTNVALPNYSVSPDGERFLMTKDTEPDRAKTQINVVLNWFEEVKRRAPAQTK